MCVVWGYQTCFEVFEKIKYLVKIIKKWFLKKLSIWLTLIKVVVWIINYQKWQNGYSYIYIYMFISYLVSTSY